MNISLSKEGKKMGFKKFVEVFGKHFKTLHEPFRTKKLEEVYTELTGKKVGNTDAKHKKTKEL